MTKFITNLEEKTQSVLMESLADDAAELAGYDKDQVTDAVTGLSFANYLELGNAVDIQDVETVKELLGTVADFTPGDDVDLEIEEGKWDYKKGDKGKGAGTDSPMHDGGAKNRKSRKAFRKAEKAKAHQARMRGEIEEDRYEDETDECISCSQTGYQSGLDLYGETCLNCGGRGRVMKNGDYIDDEFEDSMIETEDFDLDEPIDMQDKTCFKCHKGYFTETGFHDDMDGVLHCNECGWKIDRYLTDFKNVQESAKDPWTPDTPIPDKFRKDGKLVKNKAYKNWLQAEKDKLKEADNPSKPAVATPTQPAVVPPSAGSSIDALAQPADTAVDKDNNEMQQGRKEVDDLDIGDEIEVADIDGEPAAGRVRNANGPGDTIVITGKGNEEHMIRKDSILSTPVTDIGAIREQYETALNEDEVQVKRLPDAIGKYSDQIRFEMGPLDTMSYQDREFQVAQTLKRIKREDPKLRRRLKTQHGSWAFAKTPGTGGNQDSTGIIFIVVDKEDSLREKGRSTRIKNTTKVGDKMKRAERIEKKKQDKEGIDENWVNDIDLGRVLKVNDSITLADGASGQVREIMRKSYLGGRTAKVRFFGGGNAGPEFFYVKLDDENRVVQYADGPNTPRRSVSEGFQHSPIKVLRDVLRTQGIRVGRGYNDKNVGNRKIRVYTDNTLINTETGSSLEDLEAIVKAGMEKAGYQVQKVDARQGMKSNDPNYFPGMGRDARMYANVAVWLEGNPVGSRYQTDLDEEGFGDDFNTLKNRVVDNEFKVAKEEYFLDMHRKHSLERLRKIESPKQFIAAYKRVTGATTWDFDDDMQSIESLTESYGEETYDEMVEYWKQSLSSSIVSKGVFTQLYDAANKDIEELNAAIEDQAHSIAETYHGSGEGIGTSDVNHFIAHIGSSLGIDDLFGWRKPKLASDEDMERDKANRGAKYGKAIRAESLEESGGDFNFFVDPQEVGANVMNSNGDIHDYYSDVSDARKEAEKLNAQFGKVAEGENDDEESYEDRLARMSRPLTIKDLDEPLGDEEHERQEFNPEFYEELEELKRKSGIAITESKIGCTKCDEVSTEKAWEKNDGSCPKCNDSTQGVAENINEVKSGRFNSRAIGSTVKVIGQDDYGNSEHDGKIGTIISAEREHTFSQMVPFKIVYGIRLEDGTRVYVRRDNIRKIKIQETASGGATGAGAIASSPSAMNGVQKRNPSIYGQTKLRKKPQPKKRTTREDAGDGIGRNKKD